ncbi:putative ribonuclease H-like domain-containing protein, partial [Tanacetum coccineum]
GPNWLFDIDALTKTMNYEPVVAGNQCNSNAGTKASVNAGQARKETEPGKDYILLPFSPITVVSSTLFNADDLTDDPNMLDLEDIGIFDYEDDADVRAEADMNNLNITIPVSPIPTTRIHKDHPIEQVIRDLQSVTQTRKMSKNLEEHGRIQKVDLLNGKRAIGTKWVYRNKKDERGIVIRNKARLVAQGCTQEEGVNYDEVFTPVARIEAIMLFLAYASFKDFVVYQMDVKSTFLYEKIEEEVYVCQPPGFEDPDFLD